MINPATHPWWSKISNASLTTVGRVVVPAIALPIASKFSSDGQTSWLPNIVISAGLGAAVGGAAGLWFPSMEHDNLYRMDALRAGVIGGLFGAPAVSLALMGSAKWFLKDLLPYGNGKIVKPPVGGTTGGTPATDESSTRVPWDPKRTARAGNFVIAGTGETASNGAPVSGGGPLIKIGK